MAEFEEVKGLRELQAAMQALPHRIQTNILRGAVNAGATVIRKDAVARAPVSETKLKDAPPPGTLRRAIYQAKSRAATTATRMAYRISVKQAFHRGRGNKGVAAHSEKDAWYWRFVEFGTSKMAARPFLRPAFEAKKYEAIARMRDYLAKRIPDEIAKLRR